MSPIILHIDTHGRCNLTCPSCPRGRQPSMMAHKFITAEFLRSIIEKILSQCPIHAVIMANWTEPTLHPKLPELIRTVHNFGLQCRVSSNLNPKADYEAIMEAEPDEFTASCSGWSNETYQVTHRGAEIERFRRHLNRVALARKPHTSLVLSWHSYSHNLKEREVARLWCEERNIFFAPVVAKLLPMESVIDYFNNFNAERLTQDEQTVVNLLEEPLRSHAAHSKRYNSLPCRPQDHELVLDCEGNVTICSNLWDPVKSNVGNIFTHSVKQIQSAKKQSAVCSSCKEVGGHVYMAGGNTFKSRMYIRTVDLWCKTLGKFIDPRPNIHKHIMAKN